MQPRVFSKEHPLKNEIDTLILYMECMAKDSISLDELLDYSHSIVKKNDESYEQTQDEKANDDRF